MHRTILPALVALALLPAAAAAQAHEGHSPYAGREPSDIKALTPEQVEGYLAGAGMELALPAELNGYPGPRHVLDLARELGLTPEQAAGVRAVQDEMQREAAALGRRYVESERALDRLFANRAATDDAVRAATAESARHLGALRHAHLRAHLRTTALLTPAQVQAYDRLRGYDGDAGHDHGAHRHGTR